MRRALITATVAWLIVVPACGPKEPQVDPYDRGGVAKRAQNNNASNTITTTSTNSSGTYQTSVASCDEYLAKVEKCLNNPNVPESVRTSYRTSYEQNREAWKQAAANPQTKAQLEVSCKQALDAAKPTFEQFCK